MKSYLERWKQKVISKNLNIPKGTIPKIIRKFQQTESVVTAPKPGGPRK